MKLRTRKLAAFATCLGIAAAFPVASSADKAAFRTATSPVRPRSEEAPEEARPEHEGQEVRLPG